MLLYILARTFMFHTYRIAVSLLLVPSYSHLDLEMELLVKTVGHFLYLQRGVVIGHLEVDLSPAMNCTGILVVQIDLEPAIQGYLSG